MEKLNNKGNTLLEIIVSFALLGILIVLAAELIASSTDVYYHAQSEGNGIQQTQLLLTEIRGELEDCQALPMYVESGEAGARTLVKAFNDSPSPVFVAVAMDGHGIEFVNAAGSHVAYEFKDGVFYEYFYPEYDIDFADTGEIESYTVKRLSYSDVFTDKKIGMGYSIRDVVFTAIIPDGTTYGGPSCPTIRVDVTLFSEEYGTYTNTEYVELYGFYSPEHRANVRTVDRISR